MEGVQEFMMCNRKEDRNEKERKKKVVKKQLMTACASRKFYRFDRVLVTILGTKGTRVKGGCRSFPDR